MGASGASCYTPRVCDDLIPRWDQSPRERPKTGPVHVAEFITDTTHEIIVHADGYELGRYTNRTDAIRAAFAPTKVPRKY